MPNSLAFAPLFAVKKVDQAVSQGGNIMFEKALTLYEQLRENHERYSIPYYLVCFLSIDAFIKNPTKEEYEVISDTSCWLYSKLDDVQLETIVDSLSKQYANQAFTLEELNEMDQWEVLEYIF